jgi:STE24 endopeptidase
MIEWNFLFLLYLIFFAARAGTQLFLNRLNTSYLIRHGNNIPDPFRDVIDREKLQKISSYTIDSSRFGITAVLANQFFFLVVLVSGLLPWIVGRIHEWGLGLIAGALVFFAFFSAITQVVHLPFSLYGTFVIESRYGFNTRSPKDWFLDALKGLAISAPLGALFLWVLLSLIKHTGSSWWIWAWIAVAVFELLVLWLYPVLIAPLFNKFEPLRDEEFVKRIEALMGKSGLRAKGVFRMDASRRSRHTNAYFTGIGKSKRIVLFDTLLNSHTPEEVLAILAHEIGHWKKKHVLKQLVFAEIITLIGFFVVAQLLDWPLIYRTFGFPEPLPYVGLFLVGALFSPVGYFAQPIEAMFSRKFEREADDFSVTLLGTAEPMGSALKRLAADNLANLNPHPVYAWFYYSHPPLVERVERLKDFSPQRALR